MELFGIILSVPFCFIAGSVSAGIINWFLKAFGISPSLVRIIRFLSLVLLILSVGNIVNTIIFGPCWAWNLLNNIYLIGSNLLFLSTPPALVVFLSTTAEGKRGPLNAFVIGAIVSALSLIFVLEQYYRSEAIEGIDGDNTSAVCRKDNQH